MQPTFRVASRTDPKALASAITHALYSHETVQLSAVGAAAVNQAIKAVAVARGFLAGRRMDLSVVPEFATVQMPDAEVSTIVLVVVRRRV